VPGVPLPPELAANTRALIAKGLSGALISEHEAFMKARG
jgi:hypothetical protein